MNEKKAIRMANKGLIVCRYCKPANVKLTHLANNRFGGKQFVCSGDHLTVIYPFTNGFCNVDRNGEQENIEAEPEVMQEMIDTGVYKCEHLVDRNGKQKRCNRKLRGVDPTPLSMPSPVGIKTRTRVGDIWDRAGCPEPKDARIEIETRDGKAYDAHLSETEFSRRNRRRVKEMRRKAAQRNTNPAGEILDKPTGRSYKEERPRRPRKSDL